MCMRFVQAQPLLLRLAFHEMLDQDMEDLDMYEIYKVMSAATQCTKSKPLSRPSMTQVSLLAGLLLSQTNARLQKLNGAQGLWIWVSCRCFQF